MTQVLMVSSALLGVLCAVLLGLFLSYRRRFYMAVCRDMGFAIPTAELRDFDARFAPDELGVAKRAEVTMLPAAGKIIGGTNEREAWILAAMAKDAEQMFEFGTASGRTTYLWARNSPAGARIGSITLHPDHAADYQTVTGDSVVSTRDAKDESRFEAFVYSRTDVAGKVTQYFGDSKAFDETDWAGRCDVVFVDGSHAYSYVESDSAKAMRMVKPGGVVLWHDYRADAPGRDVRRYLDALAKELPLVRLAGTRLVAYRAPARSSSDEALSASHA